MKIATNQLNKKYLAFWSAGALMIIFIGYLIFFYDSVGIRQQLRGKRPFAIRVALLDDRNNDSLELLAQLLVYPASQQVLIYFVNTAAYNLNENTPFKNKSPANADQFQLITGIKSSYHITITRSNAIRLIDLCEGLPYFLDSPLFLKDSLYQYPEGHQIFNGEQALEYALKEEMPTTDVKSKKQELFENLVKRQHRIESLLLNLLWQHSELAKKLKSKELELFGASLVDKDLDYDELTAMLKYIEQSIAFSILEVPLTVISTEDDSSNSRLAINTASGTNIYKEFTNKIETGQFVLNIFSMEILNGTEQQGLARRLKQFIDDQTFLILVVSNYPHKPLTSTTILERSGNSLAAKLLAKKTGAKKNRIFFSRRGGQVDITFAIGTDFNFKNIRLN